MKQKKEIQRQEEMIRRFKQHGTEKLAKRAASREKRLAAMEITDRPEGEHGKMKLSFHQNFQSGRDVDKFADYPMSVSENGLAYVTTGTNAYISAKVTQTLEFETHTLFIADVTGGEILAEAASATYDYYHKNIKEMPAAQASESGKSSWVCKICGYVHEGDELPADFVCPWCKHGPEDFEKK